MKAANRVIHFIEKKVDRARFELRKKLNLIGPIQPFPYLGFGRQDLLYLRGRVLEKKSVIQTTPFESNFRHFRNMVKRFFSKEIPDTQLVARHKKNTGFALTDDEGYFDLFIKSDKDTRKDKWTEVAIQITDAPAGDYKGIHAKGKVLVPPASAEYGIISDIDDTIVKTYATDLWKMLTVTMFTKAESRLPFKGVQAFYKALEKGKSGSADNPFFYVSSSPWNIYDFLINFFLVKDIPAGPLMLKDYGLSRESVFSKGHMNHKLEQINKVLNFYPDLKFILIGDNGQKDPEIYREVIKRFPNRILAVYIRDLQLEGKKDVYKVSAESSDSEVPFILAKDTITASRHAFENGFIKESQVSQVEAKIQEKESK